MTTDDDDIHIEALRAIASDLNTFTAEESDHFQYDSITESIVWDDEGASEVLRHKDALSGIRPILRHRAAIILEEPDLKWERYWQIAKQLFPSWVGFSESRVNPNSETKEFLRKHVAETRAYVARILERDKRKRGA